MLGGFYATYGMNVCVCVPGCACASLTLFVCVSVQATICMCVSLFDADKCSANHVFEYFYSHVGPCTCSCLDVFLFIWPYLAMYGPYLAIYGHI